VRAIAETEEVHRIETIWGPRCLRRRPGEPLHPDREPLDTLEHIRRTIGEYNFAGQYQQSPAVSTPPPVIDLMAALKRSLAREAPAKGGGGNKERRTRALANRRQPPLLLPVSGGQKRNAQPATEPTAIATRRRKKG
jgi:hypothetical protein